MGRHFGPARLACAVLQEPGNAASLAHPPDAPVQSHRRRSQRTHGLHHDRISESEGGSGFHAPERLFAGRGRTREATVLREVFVPGMPYRGHEEGQGLHRADVDAGWIAADGSVDLSMDEESTIPAPGNDRAEPCHERCRRACGYSVFDVAKRRREILWVI